MSLKSTARLPDRGRATELVAARLLPGEPHGTARPWRVAPAGASDQGFRGGGGEGIRTPDFLRAREDNRSPPPYRLTSRILCPCRSRALSPSGPSRVDWHRVAPSGHLPEEFRDRAHHRSRRSVAARLSTTPPVLAMTRRPEQTTHHPMRHQDRPVVGLDDEHAARACSSSGRGQLSHGGHGGYEQRQTP